MDSWTVTVQWTPKLKNSYFGEKKEQNDDERVAGFFQQTFCYVKTYWSTKATTLWSR